MKCRKERRKANSGRKRHEYNHLKNTKCGHNRTQKQIKNKDGTGEEEDCLQRMLPINNQYLGNIMIFLQISHRKKEPRRQNAPRL